jgi:hypothetical protein
MNYWSVEVLFYEDGIQATNTYYVRAYDQNEAMNKARHRFEKFRPGTSCMVQNVEKAGG